MNYLLNNEITGTASISWETECGATAPYIGEVSDVEYTGSSDNVKTVYQAKAVTNIRKLVTEGYIKIDRQTQDVSITAEKATL